MSDIEVINGDIVIESGDLNVKDALRQNQSLLLESNKGEWKQSPTVGVGVNNYLKDTNLLGLKAEIKRQLQQDGMTINKLEVNYSKIKVDANY